MSKYKQYFGSYPPPCKDKFYTIDCLRSQLSSTSKMILFFNHLGQHQPEYMFFPLLCYLYIKFPSRSTSYVTSHKLTQLPCSHGWKRASWVLQRLNVQLVGWIGTNHCSGQSSHVQGRIDYLVRQTSKHLKQDRLLSTILLMFFPLLS